MHFFTNPPTASKIYDEYNPEIYDSLVSVDYDYILKIDDKLNEINMYCHTLAKPQKGLAYCGITLIPPEAMPEMLLITEPCPKLQPLTQLLKKVLTESKYIIHFGI